MPVLASTILDRAAKTLLDDDADAAKRRWKAPELLDHLNSGLRAIVHHKPEANAVNAWMALNSADSKQVIPAAGVAFINLIRNRADAPGKTGRAIRMIDRNDLDHADPCWHTRESTEVEHFVHDPRDRRVFYVYPRAVGDVLLVYAAYPDPIESASDEITLEDGFDTPLYHWVLARAYEKNAKRGDVAKSLQHMNHFFTHLGVKVEAGARVAPTPKENPPVGGV